MTDKEYQPGRWFEIMALVMFVLGIIIGYYL